MKNKEVNLLVKYKTYKNNLFHHLKVKITWKKGKKDSKNLLLWNKIIEILRIK